MVEEMQEASSLTKHQICRNHPTFHIHAKIFGDAIAWKLILLDFLTIIDRDPKDDAEIARLAIELDREGSLHPYDMSEVEFNEQNRSIIMECANEKISLREETGIPLLFRIGKAPRNIEELQSFIYQMDCLLGNISEDYECDDDDYLELQEEYEMMQDRRQEEMERFNEQVEQLTEWIIHQPSIAETMKELAREIHSHYQCDEG